ncbi:MAG: hypothetical protein KDB03_10875 [Planctomycetales bacterium]|nr:hypothetical protein [Planctomycetales bacterium]
MSVCGLVLTLCDDSQLRAETIAELGRWPQISLGEEEFNRLPLVLDTPSRNEDRALLNRLEAMPGVLMVEVAFVGFDEHSGNSQSSRSAAIPGFPEISPDTQKDDRKNGF